MNSNAVVVVTLVVSVVLSTGSTIHESNPGPEPNSFKKLLNSNIKNEGTSVPGTAHVHLKTEEIPGSHAAKLERIAEPEVGQAPTEAVPSNLEEIGGVAKVENGAQVGDDQPVSAVDQLQKNGRTTLPLMVQLLFPGATSDQLDEAVRSLTARGIEKVRVKDVARELTALADKRSRESELWFCYILLIAVSVAGVVVMAVFLLKRCCCPRCSSQFILY